MIKAANALPRIVSRSVPRGQTKTILVRCQFRQHVANATLPNRTRPAAIQTLFVEHCRRAIRVGKRVHQIEDSRHLAEVFFVNHPDRGRAVCNECLPFGRRDALFPSDPFQGAGDGDSFGAGDHFPRDDFRSPREAGSSPGLEQRGLLCGRCFACGRCSPGFRCPSGFRYSPGFPYVFRGFPLLREAGNLGDDVTVEQPIGKFGTRIVIVNLARHRQRQPAGLLFPVRPLARLAEVIATLMHPVVEHQNADFRRRNARLRCRAVHQRFVGEHGDLLATLGHPVFADVRRDSTHLFGRECLLRENLQRLGCHVETGVMRSSPDRLLHHPRRDQFTNGPLEFTRQREKNPADSGSSDSGVRHTRFHPAVLAE